MSVQTAVVDLYLDPSDHQRTGKAITILAMIQQVPTLSIDPLIQALMRYSLPKLNQYRLNSGNSGQ
jgi:hypothetical protein